MLSYNKSSLSDDTRSILFDLLVAYIWNSEKEHTNQYIVLAT